MEHVAEAMHFKVSPALDHAISRIAELARECGDKGREIDKLRNRIAELSNKRVRPDRGNRVFDTFQGDAPITLEFEYEPAEVGSWDEPSYPASVAVTRVWIGGEPLSSELFNTSTLDAWESEILTSGDDE
jgi:hypothetical protein